MRVVGVFAKYWAAGSVKTRLAATLGTEAATEFYRRMLHGVLRQVRAAAAESYVIAFAPTAARGAFAEAAPEWEVQPQAEGDLGQRLTTFCQQQFDRGATRVVVVGSDCLEIDAGVIQSVWRLLDEVPIVWGPACDGGYYLLGLSRPVPELFVDIPWSTARVLVESQARAAAVGLPQAELPLLDDIDDAVALRDWSERQRDSTDAERRDLARWASQLLDLAAPDDAGAEDA